MKTGLSPKIFLLAPIATYVLAATYLMVYHHALNIFAIPIHESGELNLLQTTFYSSHFIGHIPVHVCLAFIFAGCLKSLFGNSIGSRLSQNKLLLLLAVFLIFCFSHSFWEFGAKDTLSYLFQQRQGVDISGDGGSWKLHLISTITIPFLIPIYLLTAAFLTKTKVAETNYGLTYILTGLILIPIITLAIERQSFFESLHIFKNNRYLAHSVREVATFPLTYFPIPLYFIFGASPKSTIGNQQPTDRTKIVLLMATLIFLILMSLQVISPLQEGIGKLAQKPDFAKMGKLNISYLLASHYFEHFLDSIFFTLLVLLLLTKKKENSLNQT